MQDSKLKQIGIVLGITLSIFFAVSVALAWSGPTANPPNENIANLFNLSGETQTFENSKTVKVKEDGTGAIDIEGGLGVHGVGDFQGNVSAPEPTADSHLATKSYVDSVGGLNGYERVSNGCGNTKTCTVSCPSGKVIVGGGCRSADWTVKGSYATSDSGWRCEFSGSWNSWTRAYAICVNP